MVTYIFNIILTAYQEASTIPKISDPPSTGSEGNDICNSWEPTLVLFQQYIKKLAPLQ